MFLATMHEYQCEDVNIELYTSQKTLPLDYQSEATRKQELHKKKQNSKQRISMNHHVSERGLKIIVIDTYTPSSRMHSHCSRIFV